MQLPFQSKMKPYERQKSWYECVINPLLLLARKQLSTKKDYKKSSLISQSYSFVSLYSFLACFINQKFRKRRKRREKIKKASLKLCQFHSCFSTFLEIDWLGVQCTTPFKEQRKRGLSTRISPNSSFQLVDRETSAPQPCVGRNGLAKPVTGRPKIFFLTEKQIKLCRNE